MTPEPEWMMFKGIERTRLHLMIVRGEFIQSICGLIRYVHRGKYARTVLHPVEAGVPVCGNCRKYAEKKLLWHPEVP